VLAAISGARWPELIRASGSQANVSVHEVAAFDEPYNLAMEPTPRRAALAPRLPLGVS